MDKIVKKINFVWIAFPFFLAAILFTNGLQDWWPEMVSLLRNGTLYNTVHYSTGPLYPALLTFLDLSSNPAIANKILGLLFIVLYILLFGIYVSPYTNNLYYRFGPFIFYGLLFTAIFSRYTSPYQVFDDYHTLSLIIYLLIFIKQTDIKYPNNFYGKLGVQIAKLPIWVYIGLLILNRTHEGILLLIIYEAFYFIKLKFIDKIDDAFKIFYKLLAVFLGSISVFALVLLLFRSINLIGDVFSAINTIFFTASASKNISFVKIINNFILNFNNNNINILIFFILLGFGFKYLINFISLYYNNKNKVFASLIIYTCIIILFLWQYTQIELVGFYRIIPVFFLLLYTCHLFNMYLSDCSIPEKHILPFLSLPLIISHLLSTTGLVNESFALLVFIPILYNLGAKYDRLVKPLLIFIAILSLSLIYDKLVHIRSWWLFTEPPITSKRTFMYGSSFEKKYPHLNSSLTYGSDNFLSFSNELCSKVSVNGTILSYPVPYYNFACKKNLVNYSGQFSLWYDVAPPSILNDIIYKLKYTKPDYVVTVTNPLSLYESSAYYSKTGYKNYYHNIFYNQLLNKLDSQNYELSMRYWLVNGQPVLRDTDLYGFVQSLDAENCFHPDNFLLCRDKISKLLNSSDVTQVSLWKNQSIIESEE